MMLFVELFKSDFERFNGCCFLSDDFLWLKYVVVLVFLFSFFICAAC